MRKKDGSREEEKEEATLRKMSLLQNFEITSYP